MTPRYPGLRPQLVAQGSGAVLNILSVLSWLTKPWARSWRGRAPG